MYEIDKSYIITTPKKKGLDAKADPGILVVGKYGTLEMSPIFGRVPTFGYCLKAQAAATQVLSELYPNIVPQEHATVLIKTANLQSINPQRIIDIEDEIGHDVIAIDNAWEEAVMEICPEAASDINKFRTSADSTETAKALQLKNATEIIIDSLENLRDITLEKSMAWSNIPHMDQTHRYDALPTYAGRPFSHYAEMLQSDINLLKHFYNNSLVGKWGDSTGNHHSATALNVNGIELQKAYCEALGLKYMDAAAQTPGREFISDFAYGIARTAETMANLATYIANGRGDDVNLFVYRGRKQKGSAGMPHKDEKGGNPTKEEQTVSFANYTRGAMMTALSSDLMFYARDLSGSASDRVTLEIMFKWGDEVIRNLANVVYHIDLNMPRSIERVERSLGVVTSAQVMTYLTDRIKTSKPLPRSIAHDLMGELSTKVKAEKKPFVEILLGCDDVTSRLDENVIREISDPLKYVGQSKKVIEIVYQKYHGNHIFPKNQALIENV
ncbi:MAG: lyase family protein [Nanoarchaeota archaeon]|nr:hypothetical protein [Nanoarchaeota archaeon]MBU4452191.1 hypothetical protein [Nanoarchaeota archaeon]